MGFPRQEHWSGLPLPSSGDLPDPGIMSPAMAGRFFLPLSTQEAQGHRQICSKQLVIKAAQFTAEDQKGGRVAEWHVWVPQGNNKTRDKYIKLQKAPVWNYSFKSPR